MRTAAYLRYSSDLQRNASLEDQLRNIRAHCERQGWPMPLVYQDAAVSGSRDDRPGYRQALADANAGRFDVLLVDDLSRLSRDSSETANAIKRLKFSGVRLVGVSDGTDTAREGHELDTGVRALIGEHYLRDLAKKTHRGLEGRALEGASAGGLPYGYQVTSTGQRAIDPAQAEVVRRIFAEFARGNSPREIAALLNAEQVPTARGRTWCLTAIYGDLRRGIGILANPIYIGQQVWNRSKWVKHPETHRRSRIERPQSEWITTQHPELAIVDAALWRAAQARLQSERAKTAERIASGKKGGGGARNKHLLSGLLRCEQCGSPMTVANAYTYRCSAAKDRGAAICDSKLSVPIRKVEPAILNTVRRELLTEARYQQFEAEARKALKAAAADESSARRRLQQAEQIHGNVMAALRAGIITSSTKAELLTAEANVASAKRDLEALRQFQPAQMLPRARQIWRDLVAALDTTGTTAEQRAALRELLGEKIVVRQRDGELFAEIPATSAGEMTVVAGAGFVRYLHQPLVIPIR